MKSDDELVNESREILTRGVSNLEDAVTRRAYRTGYREALEAAVTKFADMRKNGTDVPPYVVSTLLALLVKL